MWQFKILLCSCYMLARISEALPYLALPLTHVKSNVTHYPHLKSPIFDIVQDAHQKLISSLNNIFDLTFDKNQICRRSKFPQPRTKGQEK